MAEPAYSGSMNEREPAQEPIISNRFLFWLTSIIATLALFSVGISIVGREYGEALSLAGHSESDRVLSVTIGRDSLSLVENTVRFESQRRDGRAERVDLYLLWPEMRGYSRDDRRRFDDLSRQQSLLFLQISQSTMSRDMSGRMEPIYANILKPERAAGPAGLAIQRFEAGHGFDGELLLSGQLPDGSLYAIRCQDSAAATADAGDCQRDIHVGDDLTVLYRFPNHLIGQWAAIEHAVRGYVEERTSPLSGASDR
ncbi:hypothetical protein FE840_012920 [Peteryoungia desertarenae]|uniref:Transmembrane anchored protein n=1 Tax=Peteryoungia desertarenae TaxID=1813451 RepID=A0ABX6QPF8_9HYPH|nr:hypothetical protein [Peteryoungia desertarenae]QLF70364.1 hypothetical protein FE840_012920 [Peteryoungia desertarenae]